MEYLRWILLVAGLIFVLVIYLIGKNRRRQDSYSDYDSDDEVPEFSASDWDDVEEGVGKVRIIARENSEYVSPDYDDVSDVDDKYDQNLEDELHDAQQTLEATEESYQGQQEQQPEHQPEQQPEQQDSDADIVVLYILARSPNQLAGDKINSAALANGLVFGKMNIFHRIDDDGLYVFSLANMVEPGNFDPVAMHDIQTPGIIFFMQVSDVTDPDNAFDDMLQCAYRISEMLDAQLCNRKRQPLTQSDAEEYREQVAGRNA